MKIVALGGAGAVGSAALHALNTLGCDAEIVVADRDLAAARAVAEPLEATPEAVDATDARTLRAVLEDADLVVNTAGPFYRFGPLALRAAIDTRTHYVDVCDDWQPMLDMLELSDRAEQAGVAAVIGMGASPGLSNLMAAHAAAKLDRVEQLYTVWPVDPPGHAEPDTKVLTGADGRPSAAALHWLQQLSDTVPVARGGALVRERPLRPIALQLPGGRAGTIYTVGHPEPVTLRTAVAPDADIACGMVITPGTVAFLDALRKRIDDGHATVESAARQLARPGVWAATRALLAARRWDGPGTLPPFFVVAIGWRDGRPSTQLVRLNDEMQGLISQMARATGVPLAIGVQQIISGAADRLGVSAPEAAVDRVAFFAALAAYCGQPDSVLVESTP